jgi:hypothetical protein
MRARRCMHARARGVSALLFQALPEHLPVPRLGPLLGADRIPVAAERADRRNSPLAARQAHVSERHLPPQRFELIARVGAPSRRSSRRTPKRGNSRRIGTSPQPQGLKQRGHDGEQFEPRRRRSSSSALDMDEPTGPIGNPRADLERGGGAGPMAGAAGRDSRRGRPRGLRRAVDPRSTRRCSPR